MQGNLKQIQLPEVLQFISMGKSTGLLTVRDADGMATTLMIRQGRIINSSALERQRRLGELLIHRGILKRSVLAQLLALQRTVDSDKRLGEILVEREIVSDETIREVLRLQLEEEIWNLFGLEEGDFKFEQVDSNQLGEATVQLDIEPLLLEGTRRQDEWRKILRLLPSDKIVLTTNDIRRLKEGSHKIHLTPSEWKVIAQINGETTIRGVVNRSGMGRFEVYRIVFDFLNRKLVSVKKAVEEPLPESYQELEDASGDPSGANTRRVGGLFSRLTGAGTRRDGRVERFDFISPIGSVSHFVNRMSEQVYAHRDMRQTEGDDRLVDEIWKDLLVNFTKADLVRAYRNRVYSQRLETYLKLFEFNEAVQDCYEDSIEALLQLVDTLFHVYSSRIGDRAVTRIMRETLDEMRPRLSHEFATGFNLEERIQGVLKLSAA